MPISLSDVLTWTYSPWFALTYSHTHTHALVQADMDSSSAWIKAAPAENYQYNVAMQEMQGALSGQTNVQQVTKSQGLGPGARLGLG